MRTLRPFALVCLVSLGACVSAAPAPPEESAPKIVALLDAGKASEADELFAAGRDPAWRDALYPLLYERARTRFEQGEAHGAAAVLRFMSHAYPGSVAVREGLVYALFLERAASREAPPELVKELGTVVAGLESDGGKLPAWIELARAQQAIDDGQPGTAREALARFQHESTDVTPAILLYAEDIERFLSTQP